MFKPVPVGWRMIKTVVALYICFIISMIFHGDRSPIYSAIAAIIVMQKDANLGRIKARNRIVGTLLGGAVGLIAVYLFDAMNLISFDWLHYLLITVFVFIIIYLEVVFDLVDSISISCVVFLAIVLTRTADTALFIYVYHRVVDTLIGIIVSLESTIFFPIKP